MASSPLDAMGTFITNGGAAADEEGDPGRVETTYGSAINGAQYSRGLRADASGT